MVLLGKLGMESSDVAFVDVVDEASVGTDETNQGLKKITLHFQLSRIYINKGQVTV